MRAAEALARILPSIVAVTAVWAYEIRFPIGPAMVAAAIAVDVWRWRSLSRRPQTSLTRRAVRMPELVILFLYVAVFGTLALAIQVDATGKAACLPELQAQIGAIFNTANRQLLRSGGFCDGPLAAPSFVMLVSTPVCFVAWVCWKAVIYELDTINSIDANILPLTVKRGEQKEALLVMLTATSLLFLSSPKINFSLDEKHFYRPTEVGGSFLFVMIGFLGRSILMLNSALWSSAYIRREEHVKQ